MRVSGSHLHVVMQPWVNISFISPAGRCVVLQVPTQPVSVSPRLVLTVHGGVSFQFSIFLTTFYSKTREEDT